MNILFLRGQVDKRTQRVDRLEESSDMWTHLAAELAGDDDGVILYWGGDRTVRYKDKFYEKWVPKMKDYECHFKPDVVFARGGFPEYEPVVKRDADKAVLIYYGAGKRYYPQGWKKYDIILVDSPKQRDKVKQKIPWSNPQLWVKPAAPHFYPRDVPKEYDICYIANGQQAKIKRIKEMYENFAHMRKTKVLHLGYPSKHKPPPNVTCVRVDRVNMPEWISKCKRGCALYSGYDSAPRAIAEMRACGLKVDVPLDVPDMGVDHPSVAEAAQHIKNLIQSMKHE